jgi:hypothetical protein
LKAPKPFHLSWDDQVFVLAEWDAMLGGKSFCPFSHEIYVRALAQDLASRSDGIGDAFHAPNAPGAKRGSIHDEGIELYFAFTVQEAAASGIEGLVVFHNDDGFFYGIECRATAAQYPPAGTHSIPDAVQMRIDEVIRNRPGSTMNNEDWIGGQTIP